MDYLENAKKWLRSFADADVAGGGTGRDGNEDENVNGPLTLEHHVMSAVTYVEAERGRCVVRLPVTEQIQNRYGTLHGGATSTLIDTVSSAALMTIIGLEGSGVSTDLNVTFISAARLGDIVEVEGTVLKAGRTLAFLEATIRKLPGNEIVARGRHSKFVGTQSLGKPQAKL
eukprot:TRINITY_DN19475_c0_g1_i1.p1 TRINITY_DN19475_c0_g1~~TRINITY_DN19475_c0_g1_i1.p1  ORF type:complete len:172 (-),score=26.57 TRINITY_DN19475_c0_g1_i1:821-1336(-)